MPRPAAPARFADIVAAATTLLIERGYRRTRMVDIARFLGVTEPALYRYFEGKDALFDEVVRSSVGEGRSADGLLPIPNPGADSTLGFLRRVIAREARIDSLVAALDSVAAPADARNELRTILEELLANLQRNRVGLKVLERAAPDWPELAAMWFGHARARIHGQLSDYLARRAGQERLRPLSDAQASARLILEVLAYVGVHRQTDPFPTAGDAEALAAAAIDDLLNAYVPQEAPRDGVLT